ncbi:MAG: hypothetical protein KZQ81_17040 [Candidatus Thiodiazotropha sp. (ex Rostrolucina anterorostrata)]|nr:hypothetical protein [Candidatus Thiodiazotropha sp. (ex Rostrolucina anterorostrata)]
MTNQAPPFFRNCLRRSEKSSTTDSLTLGREINLSAQSAIGYRLSAIGYRLSA